MKKLLLTIISTISITCWGSEAYKAFLNKDTTALETIKKQKPNRIEGHYAEYYLASLQDQAAGTTTNLEQLAQKWSRDTKFKRYADMVLREINKLQTQYVADEPIEETARHEAERKDKLSVAAQLAKEAVAEVHRRQAAFDKAEEEFLGINPNDKRYRRLLHLASRREDKPRSDRWAYSQSGETDKILFDEALNEIASLINRSPDEKTIDKLENAAKQMRKRAVTLEDSMAWDNVLEAIQEGRNLRVRNTRET